MMLWLFDCKGGEYLEDWKIKIAVLWSLLEFCLIAIFVEETYLLNLGEMIADTTPELMMVLLVTILIPPIMAFLSLALKDSVNRWVNIILGIVFMVLMPFGFPPFPTAYLPPVVIITIVEIVALVLIIWYAWKSKQKA
jgi:Na+/glutamate symporter